MMLRILCLLGVLSSVSCECHAKQFCFPKQWQSLVKFTNVTSDGHGAVQIQPGSAAIFIDDVDEEFRTDVLNSHGKSTILVLYKQNVGYFIANDKCTPFKPGHKYNMTLCTPENAIISQPYLIGYKPSLKAIDYNFHFLDTSASISVADNTDPVSMRAFETLSGKVSVLSTIMFEDYSPTKPNPKVFVVPSICKHGEQDDAKLWETWASRPLWQMLQ